MHLQILYRPRRVGRRMYFRINQITDFYDSKIIFKHALSLAAQLRKNNRLHLKRHK